MTGRCMGYCAGYDIPGYANQGYGYGRGAGRGFGAGMGRGMAYGRGFGRGLDRSGQGYSYQEAQVSAPYSEVSEKTFLQNEINVLKEQLKGFEERLSDIAKEEE